MEGPSYSLSLCSSKILCSTIRLPSIPWRRKSIFGSTLRTLISPHYYYCYSPSTVVSCSNNTNSSSKNGGSNDENLLLTSSSAYQLLGVSPNCSLSDLKSAFRSKVKQFHPDVRKDGVDSDTMIRRVIQAYELLSNYSKSEIIERECLDPFEEPECEAFDLFVNEALCIGKDCPYSCVKRAPNAFAFASSTGTARVISQGYGEDYEVQQAVGQCPRSCIHYVTPSQRIILAELLHSILEVPYDCSAEADLLYALIVKAKYENNRYQKKPKKEPKVSTKNVDWF